MKFKVLLVSLLLIAAVSGCGGGYAEGGNPIGGLNLSSAAGNASAPTSVPTTVSSAASNQSSILISAASNQSSTGSTTNITSSNTSVESGVASSASTTTVEPTSQSFTFAQVGPLDLRAGDVLTNQAKGQGDGAVVYSSDNNAVAIVDSGSGQVNVMGAGTAVITANKAADTKYVSARVSYTIHATSINQTFTFAQSGPIKFLAGDTVTNLATGQGSGLVTYKSSNTDVATIDSTGKVTLVGAGSAIITADKTADAHYLAASASYTLYSQAIAFNQAGPVNLVVGDSLSNPAMAQGTGLVTYTSSNTSIATVTSNGWVTVVGAGNAVITANKAADMNYLAAEASYSISASLVSQTLSFAQTGPIDLELGGSLSNLATGQGMGAVSYSSSDNSVATVDSSGQVTIVGVGSAVITANKAADTKYRSATANYTVNVSVAVTAWVGSKDTLVNFPAGMNGFEFYRSSDSNCDFTNYLSCLDGQMDFLTGSVVTDTAATLDRNGYYVLKSGNKLGSLILSSSTSNEELLLSRYDSKIVSFNNKLFLIGGSVGSTVLNDVWQSDDGIRWALVNVNAGFTPRGSYEVIAHKGKLWSIGGFGDHICCGDVWSSENGINWIRQIAWAPFGIRYDPKVVVFNDELWVIGGTDDLHKDHHDIWSSKDGVEWVLRNANPEFSARRYHQVVIFNGKFWIFGGANDSVFQNDIWSSIDGISWVQEAVNIEFKDSFLEGAIVYNSKLWLIARPNGSLKLRVWTSSDGIIWTLQAADEQLPHAIVTYKDQLLLLGAGNVWSSADGTAWRKGVSGTFKFQ